MANELIRQVEVVSAHFSYTEEYVLDKSIAWVNRKFEQAQREKHDDYAQNANSITSGVYMSVMAVMSQAFGGGKDNIDLTEMMVKGYDETINKQKETSTTENKIVESGGNQWDMSYIDEERARLKRKREKQKLEQG